MANEILNSLKQAREKAGLTQKDVEATLNMRSLMMRDYEIGRLKLPITVCVELAKLYGVSVDELIGNEQVMSRIHQSKVLVNFDSLFIGNGFSIMFLDPILRAFLEDHYEKHFDSSLFELLTEDFSEKKKKSLVLEISKLLATLASSDGKVTQEEVECLKYLLFSFNLQSRYKDISANTAMDYLPECLPDEMKQIEMRHFIIWIMFFFAHADKKLCYQEMAYIEKCAEVLRLNKTNFLFIKNKFLKGNI